MFACSSILAVCTTEVMRFGAKTQNVVQIERPNTSSRIEIKFVRGLANPRTFGGKAVATKTPQWLYLQGGEDS